MGNDLEVSTGSQQVAVRTNEVAKRISDLERGGYYKNVVSPEEYLKGNKDSSTNTDVEIYDEQSQPQEKKEVVPLKHWNEKIQAKFDECTDSQKKAWLDSFKIVEKNYVKQLNYLKDDIATMQPVMAQLEPLKPQIDKLGKTPAEYIKTLIDFDMCLGQDPTYEIARLISHHKVRYDDLYNVLPAAAKDIEEINTMSKYISPLHKELSDIKAALGYSSQDTVDVGLATKAAEEMVVKITKFFEQRDSSGKEMYPGAFDCMPDIIELVQAGEDLATAYNHVVKGQSQTQEPVEEEGVDYDEPNNQNRRKVVNALDKEKEMLRAVLNKISR
jgi:cupin superfamily acireductone dioxygenase involved in methionine salvage